MNEHFSYNFRHDYKTVETALDDKLESKVIAHRDDFFHIEKGKYLEMLPSQFIVPDAPSSLDWYKAETALMFNYKLAIGLDVEDKLVILGYITKDNTETNPMRFIFPERLTHDDIYFIIPEDRRKEGYLEIIPATAKDEGNFFVLRNKGLSLVPDYAIIEHYCKNLAEIEGSRYSLEIQAKVSTVFRGRAGSVTVDNAVESLFNGAPVLKASADFEPTEDVITMGGAATATLITNLTDLEHTRKSELESELGIPNLGVDKASGVSDIEATSNDSKTDNVAEIKLKTRESALFLGNERFFEGLHVIDKPLKVMMRNDREDSLENKEYDNGNSQDNQPL